MRPQNNIERGRLSGGIELACDTELGSSLHRSLQKQSRSASTIPTGYIIYVDNNEADAIPVDMDTGEVEEVVENEV